MAKDNLGLLNEISGQLKRLNQSNIRQQIEVKEYQERQLAVQAGAAAPGEAETQFIPAGEDLKRRLKANLIGQKVAEKMTESGKRAIRSNKEAATNKKFTKLTSIKMEDRRVGEKTLIETVKE